MMEDALCPKVALDRVCPFLAWHLVLIVYRIWSVREDFAEQINSGE